MLIKIRERRDAIDPGAFVKHVRWVPERPSVVGRRS